MQISTRENLPPLRNSEIPSVGVVYRSEITKSHAREQSITQEMQISTRGALHPPRNPEFQPPEPSPAEKPKILTARTALVWPPVDKGGVGKIISWFFTFVFVFL